MQFLKKTTILLCAILAYIAPATSQALTLSQSGPVVVTQNGQVIENLHITANGQPGILIQGYSDVIIRNVKIDHQGAHGIFCVGAPRIHISNVDVTNTAQTLGHLVTATNPEQDNIACVSAADAVIENARLTGGSGGAYIYLSPRAQLRNIEGYDFRNTFPRGNLVQFNQSPGCLLEDFSVIMNPDPTVSYAGDNISIIQSDNCVIRRGLVSGNNSYSGVGVMFEHSRDGLVEDVDTYDMGNGSFSAYPSYNITFRRVRARDNHCNDQGFGPPASKSLVFAGSPDSSGLRLEQAKYYNLCNPGNILWDGSTFVVKEYSAEDFQLRSPIVNIFPWESGSTTGINTVTPDTTTTETTTATTDTTSTTTTTDTSSTSSTTTTTDTTTATATTDTSSTSSTTTTTDTSTSSGGVLLQLYNLYAAPADTDPVKNGQQKGKAGNNAVQDMMVDFGDYGLWLLRNNTEWSKIHDSSPKIIATGDLDGNGQVDAVVDFGANGIWTWTNNSTWNKIHSEPSEMIKVADIDGNGQEDALIDLGTSGLWAWMNNSSWKEIYQGSPQKIEATDINGNNLKDVLVDLGVDGLWVWMDNNDWFLLAEADSQEIAIANFDGQ